MGENSIENLYIKFRLYCGSGCCCCLAAATRSRAFHSILSQQHFVYIFGCVFNFAHENVVYLPRSSCNSVAETRGGGGAAAAISANVNTLPFGIFHWFHCLPDAIR